jgi:hypothetical protein
MLRRIFIGLVAAVTLSFAPAFATHTHRAYESPVPSSLGLLATFDTESAAQAHCLRDEVVWLNTNSAIYHEKGCVGTAARDTGRMCAGQKPMPLGIGIRGMDSNNEVLA